MTYFAFLMILAAGASFLALWLAACFPGWKPRGFREALMHFAIALALVWAAPNLVAPMLSLGRPSAVLGIFGFVLPPLTYGFLAGAWVVRLVRQALTQ